ncbi:MAG: ATP-dependent metallopeptidase FtsH/Yme1/Tma family protein [Deferribacteres bacterium]|nr:ATP-dependent metallopeptidase FtsH/Yme1/Tma family protein [Deferribacteres bacterium]
MEKRIKFSIFFYLLIFALIFAAQSLFFSGPGVEEISYKEFRDRIEAGKVETVVLTSDKIFGMLRTPDSAQTITAKDKAAHEQHTVDVAQQKTPWRLRWSEMEKEHDEMVKRQFTVLPVNDDKLVELLQAHNVDYRAKIESNFLSNFFLNWILPFGVMILLWSFIMRRMGRGSMGVLNVGKSKAKIYEVDPSQRVTFHEVAGIDEAVEEVIEVVNFLRNPGKYTRLGAKLPKGILLVGPPGTGKTLLARAVAGEAGVPFFSLSGSDFIEMFVGVGAARVRDLFNDAKAKAPCIIFIDELDAIGKSRGGPFAMGGHDERENTLNQLLTELDGFSPNLSIILMGATNRPEVLDPALLRPGRFDRQILVDRPDLHGRVQIFEVHTRELKLAADVDLKRLAAMTPGFAGAEIANACNEAALLASRRENFEITMVDFQDAIERIIAGLEKKNKLINAHERKIVAYHESGHAIIGHFTPGADPVQKVSIVPRGIGALGYTLQTPLEDRFLMSKSELLGRIKGLLGGRAAEEIIFSEVSTGASNDLERVSKIARDMITVYGMSEQVPNLSLVDHSQPLFLGQTPQLAARSEKVEQMIDEEILEIIRSCYDSGKSLLIEKRDKLEEMAKRLLQEEKLDESDILEILGPRAQRNE